MFIPHPSNRENVLVQWLAWLPNSEMVLGSIPGLAVEPVCVDLHAQWGLVQVSSLIGTSPPQP